MSAIIKYTAGKTKIEFDNGAFDEWCVYLTRPGKNRYAPTDKEYFLEFKKLGTVYGDLTIYNDFVTIFNRTDQTINASVLTLITQLAKNYGADSETIDTWFTVVYAGMIAEENKQNSKLKKRIKRLGMHQLLIEGADANLAAIFSKGKKWTELDALMKEKGF